MRFFFSTAIIFQVFLYALPLFVTSQDNTPVNDSLAIARAIGMYHKSMNPESGLYDGSEYPYTAYYPVAPADSDPFFINSTFDTGAVFYQGMLYENVPLLFDIIQGDVLVRDPSKLNIIRLHKENVEWFRLHGHTFLRLEKDSSSTHPVKTGFYTPLHRGSTSLYLFPSKQIKESSSASGGLKTYADENDEYLINKGNDYFKVKDKKSVLRVLGDRRKEIGQFIKKNKLKLRQDPYNNLPKVVAYYDTLASR